MRLTSIHPFDEVLEHRRRRRQVYNRAWAAAIRGIDAFRTAG